MAEEIEFVGAIVVCPVCSTPDDVTEAGWVSLTCGNCGTDYRVLVEAAKCAEFSMYG